MERKVHVQFFDEPPTRSWIDQRFVKVPINQPGAFEDV